MDNLELLYNCNIWTKRSLNEEEIILNHLQLSEKENKKIENIPKELDIVYGPRPRQKLDIFGRDLSDDAPVCIFIHGGYWYIEVATKQLYHYLARLFYQNGIKTVFLDYDLCPHLTIHEIITEIRFGLYRCFKIFKNSRNVSIMGHSAGAHLSSMFATLTPPPSLKAMFLISGVYDLYFVPKTSANSLIKLDEKDVESVSPMAQSFSKQDTEFWCVVGGDEGSKFIEQSRKMHEKLLSHGLRSNYWKIDNEDHYSIVENLVNQRYGLSRKILDVIQSFE